jgi:hypothetical protein
MKFLLRLFIFIQSLPNSWSHQTMGSITVTSFKRSDVEYTWIPSRIHQNVINLTVSFNQDKYKCIYGCCHVTTLYAWQIFECGKIYYSNSIDTSNFMKALVPNCWFENISLQRPPLRNATRRLKARIVNPGKTSVARQWKHVSKATESCDRRNKHESRNIGTVRSGVLCWLVRRLGRESVRVLRLLWDSRPLAEAWETEESQSLEAVA